MPDAAGGDRAGAAARPGRRAGAPDPALYPERGHARHLSEDIAELQSLIDLRAAVMTEQIDSEAPTRVVQLDLSDEAVYGAQTGGKGRVAVHVVA